MDRKWPCDKCTYENWPQSKRCTMCRAFRYAKNTMDAGDNSSNSDLSNYLNNSLIICTGVATPERKSPDSNAAQWVCNICGYFNYCHSSGKCLQCSRSSENKIRSPDTYRRQSPSGDDVNNDKNRRQLQNRYTKWACAVCTYENWPNSTKCTVCLHKRGDVPLDDNRRGKRGQRRRKSPIQGYRVPSIAGLDSGMIPQQDWLFYNACMGIVENNPVPVTVYLDSGMDLTRAFTERDCQLLNRKSAFSVGHTIVHVAVRFRRDEILAMLLASDTCSTGSVVKYAPCLCNPDLTSEIYRTMSAQLRQRKGDFPCHYFTDNTVTFILPRDITELPRYIRSRLLDEILDREVQMELESENHIINWSRELTGRLSSRLYVLWNRTAGDCLLDSILQATWGVFDKGNLLRKALAESLLDASGMRFFSRWKEYESIIQSDLFQYSWDDSQWDEEWAILLSLASQPGTALEQLHIFVLSHIVRRPIIVYGVRLVKSFRGETLGYARFEGVYLPLLWEPNFCQRSPICLGYTRGHFSGLVPMDMTPNDNLGASANIADDSEDLIMYLPLTDNEGKLLPLHFMTRQEASGEEHLLRQWLDCGLTDGGLLVAKQRIAARPPVLDRMMEEWISKYRDLVQPVSVHFGLILNIR